MRYLPVDSRGQWAKKPRSRGYLALQNDWRVVPANVIAASVKNL